MRNELRREALLRKRAHNELRELKGNIRVICRVRPAAAGSVNAHLAGDAGEAAAPPASIRGGGGAMAGSIPQGATGSTAGRAVPRAVPFCLFPGGDEA